MLIVKAEHAERRVGRWAARKRAGEGRVRIVALLRAYRAAVEAYEMANEHADEGVGPIAACEEAGEAMDQARNALFSALEELDTLEGAGP